MRPDDYLKRKHLDAHTFLENSRYVKNRVRSHKRPVEPRQNNVKVDTPANRGRTKKWPNMTSGAN